MKSSFTCLRLPLVFLALTLPILLSQNIASATKDTAEETKERGLNRQLSSAVYLTANDLSIATGKPSLVLMSKGSTHIPVWSLSGGTEGQSVAGIVNGLPGECRAVKVEIVVTSTDAGTRSGPEDLYRVHLSQMVEDG
ncbi:MAG: exo-alpha-sialidase, partial [Rhodopirellula bahusiensis]